MGSCCTSQVKESSPKPIKQFSVKVQSTDTENTQAITTSSFRYRSPKNKKKERVSLPLITNNYASLSKKSGLIPDTITQQLESYRQTHKEPETKLKDLLVIPSAKYMICKVCNDILLKPQLCSKCNLFICSHCMENTKSICNHSLVNELNDYYTNIINILSIEEFKCFNWTKGCLYLSLSSKITYDKKHNRYMIKHDEQCVHKMEKCTNPNCNYEGLYEDFIDHIYKCSHSSFLCFYCNETFTKKDKNSHHCFDTKPISFSLPIRYCSCGAILEWIVRQNSEEAIGRNRAYYRCNQCNEIKKERQSPPPIAKVCGCFCKLKGGIINQCISCKTDGGIGWSCNQCGNKISICENCINEKLEINHSD